MMKDTSQGRNLDLPAVYQIKVRGRLDTSWSDWFNGMLIGFEHESDGTPITVLTGTVVDQPALHGILARIRDLNLTLLAVARLRGAATSVQ
ncbi:MAG: hypothetical protein M5U01_41280 [Ardenticatenaceae bacterium]|nr:hypothetical protein [Ardenticatenaceae bacterium]